jgi:hypothetical protein
MDCEVRLPFQMITEKFIAIFLNQQKQNFTLGHLAEGKKTAQRIKLNKYINLATNFDNNLAIRCPPQTRSWQAVGTYQS